MKRTMFIPPLTPSEIATKLPPMSERRVHLAIPPQYDGRLKDCVARGGQPCTPRFEIDWFRAQMRDWACHWRNARLDAWLTGMPALRIARTALSLAKSYRCTAAELARKKNQ